MLQRLHLQVEAVGTRQAGNGASLRFQPLALVTCGTGCQGKLPKPVCLDMVLSYGRNKFDQVDELLKADRMLYDIFIRIIFMPLCIGIGILGLCLLSCLAKSLISMLWVSRHSICLGCVSLSKKLKRHFVEKQLYEIHA